MEIGLAMVELVFLKCRVVWSGVDCRWVRDVNDHGDGETLKGEKGGGGVVEDETRKCVTIEDCELET